MINFVRDWTSFLMLAFVGIGIAVDMVEISSISQEAKYFLAGVIIATAVSIKPKKLWYR